MSLTESGLEQSALPRGEARAAWQRPRPAAVQATELNAPRCHPVGPHFVIASRRSNGDQGLLDAVGAIRYESDALVILAAAPDAATLLREQLPELAMTAGARGATRMVIAASGLGAAAPNGRRPASRLAEMVGMTVVAPAGTVAVQSDGTLHLDAADGEQSGWWSCPPSGPPELLGPIWPPLATTGLGVGPVLTSQTRPGADTDVQVLAHGLWVRAAHPGNGPAPQVFQDISAEPGTIVVVVGAPQCPTVPQARLIEALASVPADGDLLVSAPWADLETLRLLAVSAAAQLGKPVRAAIGLPMKTPSGYSARLLDHRGSPTWEPTLTELIAMPEVRRLVAGRWRVSGSCPTIARVPVPEVDGWEAELVPAGLWVRPSGRPEDRSPRLRTPDPHRLLVIVGGADGMIPDGVWDRLAVVVERSAPAEAATIELMLHGPTTEASEAQAHARARFAGWGWRGSVPVADPLPRADEALAGGSRAMVDLKSPPLKQLDSAPEWPLTVNQTGNSSPDRVVAPAVAASAPLPEKDVPSVGQHQKSSRRIRVFESDEVPTPFLSSSEEHHASFKALLGDQYPLLLNRAQLAAARLPGLRHGLDRDITPDLVAVLTFRLDADTPATRADLIQAARSGAPGPLEAYLRCLGAGLRLLPSHQGVVLLGAQAQESELAEYRPGRLLVDPAPVVGISAADVYLGGTVEFAVWSVMGRRTSAFGSSSGDPEIAFAPGTRFAVMEVVPPADPDQPTRVLLRELGHSAAADNAAREASVRERLASWLTERDQRPPSSLRRLDNPRRFFATPGVAVW